MARRAEYVFQFPPVQGVFDTGYGIIYVFGEMHESAIEDIFHHEDLHYVIHEVAGKRAGLKLDKIYGHIIDFLRD